MLGVAERRSSHDLLWQPPHGVSALVQHDEESMPRGVNGRLRFRWKRNVEAMLSRELRPGQTVMTVLAQIGIGLANDCNVDPAELEPDRMVEVRALRPDVASAAPTNDVEAEFVRTWCPSVQLGELHDCLSFQLQDRSTVAQFQNLSNVGKNAPSTSA
jgi:hypothetical protein